MDFRIFESYINRCKVQKEIPTWKGFLNYILNLGELVSKNKMCAVEWIKLNLGMFDNAKLKIINAMREKDVINYIWIRLLIQAGKINDGGKIYINKSLPYNNETLSVVLDRTVEEVKVALDTLSKLNMITINGNNIIKIKNWSKYQNVDGLEKTKEQSKLRMRKMRARKKSENQNEDNHAADTKKDKDCYVTVTKQNESGYVTVTEEDTSSYVTVTHKNKKENKNKIKNIDEKEIDKEKNNSVSLEEKNNIVTLEDKKIKKANETAMDILSYYEKLTGRIGIFKLESIALAVDMYGEKNVRNAIDKAIEGGKMNMRYVNGILKNWAKDGYPEEGGSLSGNCGPYSDGSEFEGIEPPKPRELSEEEREKSKELI